MSEQSIGDFYALPQHLATLLCNFGVCHFAVRVTKGSHFAMISLTLNFGRNSMY